MEQRVCAGYVITQSIQVKDTEFVLGEHPKTGMCATWQCKNGDNFFWGHYCENRYVALKDLCERAAQQVDYLASIGAIPPLSSRKERDAMREDAKYGGILKSRKDMTDYCYDHPTSSFEGNYTKEYGFRVDTDHYSYMLRLNPNKGDYNIYCYCYLRQWLDRHMKQAERGIRFITPDYKEMFRIPDGDKIRMILPSREKEDRTCRYVDETHLELGRNLYHICEFAERMKDNGIEVIPLRSSLPDKCFSYLETTGEMIVITKGEKGYTPTGIYPQDASPKEGVAAVNEANGVTRAQEAAMVAGSMFGWQVPGADPKNYDEQGIPIRPKAREREDAR